MSDVPASAIDFTTTAQTAVESSGSVWPYVIGGIALVIAIGYLIIKRLNRPSFVIKQIRKRNAKAMKKEGIEGNETTADMDKLLSAVEKYAIGQSLSGTEMLKLLAPLNDQEKMKSARDLYFTMQHIANQVGDSQLAGEFRAKITGVKSNSKLMAGLFKRAGI